MPDIEVNLRDTGYERHILRQVKTELFTKIRVTGEKWRNREERQMPLLIKEMKAIKRKQEGKK